MTPREKLLEEIYIDENIYEKVLQFNANIICNDQNIKFILVAGPSCAGKTTTAKKLRRHMAANHKTVHYISLDDFYLDIKHCPVDENGVKDFETIYSLDLDLIHENMQSLLRMQTTNLPVFNFQTHSKTDRVYTINPTENDIYIVEGLHALNPLIFNGYVSDQHIYRIYLDSFEESGKNKGKTRFIRRLVRDYYYRAADAQRTFEMWDSVVAGEEKYIRPFAHLAEGCINTFFKYETSVLKKYAQAILQELPKESKYHSKANEVLRSLKGAREICPSVVPQSSLLMEFIPPEDKW